MDDPGTRGRGWRMVRRRLTFANVTAGTALFFALGGGAYAASSSFVGQHGNINTCVPRNGGEVNVWKPGHRCTGGRVNLAFPVVGAPGAKGATGPAGPAGATGPTGPAGPTGAPNPNATTVDGETVTKLQLREATPASGTTSETLYSGQGLTILAECDSTGSASLVANGPAGADAELTVSGFGSAGPAAFGSQTHTLGAASQAALGPAGSGQSSFSYAGSGGQVATGSIGYQAAPSYSTYAGCAFFGTVTAG